MSYLAHNDEDRARMLSAIGLASPEELFEAVPAELRAFSLDLPSGQSELDTRLKLESLASRNRLWGGASFLGAGCYNHFIPAAIGALISRGEFLTCYTPYQAEASQGTLQQIFEFQTAVCELTGLDVANASLYDGPSALAEAVFLALRKTQRDHVVLSDGIHPEAFEVVRTYCSGPGFPVSRLSLGDEAGRTSLPDSAELRNAGVLAVQQPNFFGVIEDIALLAQAAHDDGALLVVSQNPLTLGLLASPGSQGADLVVGDLQVFGNPMCYGGPSAGYLACREALLHHLPGRLVGETVDADGRVCYTLTLQAREQHIRRARATSNVCSNEALNALAALIYLCLVGPAGLRQLGELCVQRAHYLAAGLSAIPGTEMLFKGPFFHEFAVRVPEHARRFKEQMRARGIDPGVLLEPFYPDLHDCLLVAVTEMNTPSQLEDYVGTARAVLTGTG